MTVIYVDIEHARIRLDSRFGDDHAAKVEAARTCLVAASEAACIVVPVDAFSWEQLLPFEPLALVISGCTAHWSEYDFSGFGQLFDFIRAAPVPILGICGGHQLIGYAHGANWGPLGPLRSGESDPDPRFVPGQRKERGFLQLELNSECSLFRGLGKRAAFFQSHYWHLLEAPAGFVVQASSSWTPVQVIERRDKPVFGVEFHPERFTPEHSAGGTLLRNFFAMVRV